MRVKQVVRTRWMAGCVVALAGGAPAAAAGQSVVPFAVPPGTNTTGTVIPPSLVIPLPNVGTVNALGLTPGFYSLNLGQCMGAAFGDCKGSFLTHAASATATGGLPVDPLAAWSVLGGGGASVSTTMPGWSAFALNFPQTKTLAVPPGLFDTSPGIPSEPWTQQALSVAASPSIEMPLAPLGSSGGIGGLFTGNPRIHTFGRSESYDRLDVGWTNNPFLFPRPEFHVASLSLRTATLDFGTGPSDAILWETFTADWANIGPELLPDLQWRFGRAAVVANDLDFAFGSPSGFNQSATLTLMLERIQSHLRTDEPDAARQLWLSLNPLGMVSHDDWQRIASDIQRELPDLAAGKQSNILRPDGSFTLRVRDDIGTFLLPEPTVVPEPTTLALLGIGIVGLVLSRRRGRARS